MIRTLCQTVCTTHRVSLSRPMEWTHRLQVFFFTRLQFHMDTVPSGVFFLYWLHILILNQTPFYAVLFLELGSGNVSENDNNKL